MNTLFLTLCFYEYPAAKVHLDFWEKAMGDRILSKTKDFYVVKRSDDLELICCFKTNELPSSDMIIFVILKEILDIPKKYLHEIQYLKSLIFGKIIEEVLSAIIQLIKAVKLVLS
jgi:hypothetical protein